MKKPSMLTFSNTNACNLACSYCSTNAGKKLENELSLPEKKKLIRDARTLGVKFILLCGSGEPMYDPDFDELYDFIIAQKLRPGIITNGCFLSEKYIRRFYSDNAYLIVKCNSLDRIVNDRLLGKKDAYSWEMFADTLIPSGIARLLRAGFNTVKNKRRFRPIFEIETVITKENLDGIPAIAHFCKKTNTNLYIDTLLWLERAKINKQQLECSKAEYRWLYRELVSIFGIQYLWKEFFHICNAEKNPTVGPCGEVTVCHLRTHSMGSIRNDSLEHLFQKAQLLRKSQKVPFYKYVLREPSFRTCPAREFYKYQNEPD
jgi:MoaA/NifB/PqqE/SkfB family radical SAM enzyme